MKHLVAALSIVVAVAFIAPTVSSAQDPFAERYTGTIIAMHGVHQGETINVTLGIKGYSTEEEGNRLARILVQEGPDKLRDALQKSEKGSVILEGYVRWPVGYVLAANASDGGRIVLMISDREMDMAELWDRSRSSEYIFGVVQLKVDESGSGEGMLIEAAKLKINDKDQLEIETYEVGPQRILAVKRWTD